MILQATEILNYSETVQTFEHDILFSTIHLMLPLDKPLIDSDNRPLAYYSLFYTLRFESKKFMMVPSYLEAIFRFRNVISICNYVVGQRNIEIFDVKLTIRYYIDIDTTYREKLYMTHHYLILRSQKISYY